MEKIALKNQKQLHDGLPTAPLVSKFTKLANRFACNMNYPSPINLSSKHQSFSQSSFLKVHPLNEKQNIPPNIKHGSLQLPQLEYFKQLNTQIKKENQKLKDDLKICTDKLNKVIEEKKISEQKLLLYQETMGGSQKKIGSLMGLAHQLIVMIQEKCFISENGLIIDLEATSNKKSTKQFNFCLESKKLDSGDEMQKLKQLNKCKRNSKFKKKTIDKMMEQEKIQSVKNNFPKSGKKSTFYQETSYKFCNFQEQKSKSSMGSQQKNFNDKKQTIKLMKSTKNLENDSTKLEVLQKLISGIAKAFNDETQTNTPYRSSKKKLTNIHATNYALQQIGTFFTSLMSKQSKDSHPTLLIDSNVLEEKIKPNYSSHRILSSIKQIFDHQIYLLQKQKMHFLQHKNKRLLKFNCECSGCQRYEQMFSKVFIILREGFKEIKLKIVPELKNIPSEDMQIIL